MNTESAQSLVGRVHETNDPLEWLWRMRKTPPDAVITNQLFLRSRSGPRGDGLHWERLLHDELWMLPKTRSITVLE